MLKVLLDVDTGIDDSIAILYALKNPAVRVVGITTGCGNTSAAQATENTLRLIALANPGYPVPVAMGANRPLVGEWEGPVPHVHGENGIGDVKLPASPQQPLSESAEDFIIRMAKEHKGELVLVPLGRLTNLALALEKEPRLPKLVKRAVMMGGTVYAPGNISPVVEANVYGDPEAADRVFTAGFDLTMVGLDVTLKTRLSMQQIELLGKYAAPENKEIADYLKQALTLYMGFYRRQSFCLDHCPVHDPLAMLVATQPSLVKTRRVKARVECGGTYCRGMVVADLRERPFDGEYINICEEVDSVRAVELLLSTLGGL
jgi:inosine-uridine nucleoside N-ribohydrolase